jgi:chromosomal replication initiator protein
MAGKQIILTSDRPPKEFVKLEKRITSRFSSGIIADIQPPDLDLRIAILRNKRDQNHDDVSNVLIDFIAEKVTTNIRELEGAYLQILTKAKAEGKELTVELAEEVLGKNLNVKRGKPVSSNQVLKAVCKYYSVKSSELKGKRRTKEIVIPRQVAMYLLREMTDTPYMGIGEILGGRDHTTIMYGVDKIEAEILEPGKRRQEVNNIKQLL